MSTFVDDIKIIGPKRSGFIQKVKDKLIATFLIIDIDPISFYLSLKVEHNRSKKTIKLSQLTYIDKVLEKYYINKANTINTLMKEIELLMLKTDGKTSPSKRKIYQRMTGSLIFLMVETKSDIAFAMLVVSRFAKNLFHQHLKAVIMIF